MRLGDFPLGFPVCLLWLKAGVGDEVFDVVTLVSGGVVSSDVSGSEVTGGGAALGGLPLFALSATTASSLR